MKHLKQVSLSLVITSCIPGMAIADVFISPFTGYSFASTDFDTSQINTNMNSQLEVEESSHHGVMLGTDVRTDAASSANAYLLYSRQNTELTGAEFFSPDSFTELSVEYLHFGGTLYFSSKDIKPYVTLSAGVARLSPDGDYSDESRFSMALGAGFEYPLTQSIALFADARGYATFINSDNELFCNGNQCVWNIQTDIMWQAQVNAGLKLIF